MFVPEGTETTTTTTTTKTTEPARDNTQQHADKTTTIVSLLAKLSLLL